jgi:hypothetical protein
MASEDCSMDLIQFQKIGRIPDLSNGYSLVASSVANDHSLLFLFVEPAGKSAVVETLQLDIGTFPRTKMDVSRKFCLLREVSGRSEITELPELDLTFPSVDVFPDGRILVVASRCSWRGENDYDLNGIVFDPQSGRSTRILLGDGIEDAHVDDIGRIWVSYFDEGVVGNFGWGHPGPTPVGAAGLVCFSDLGEKIWEYPQEAHDAITDCYALNVSGSEAAIFFYTDFPICRISSDFKLKYWKTNLRGCHQLAISDTKVLLSGQYGDAADTAYLGTLEAGQLGSTKKTRLLMPDGSAMPPKGQLLGRGSHLYFFDSSDVYRVSLE